MPDPQAAPLHVSPLQHIVRRSTSAQWLVKRSRVILAVSGIPNTQIAKQVQVDLETVRR